MRLKVKVAAGAATDRIVGWVGDRLKVRVRANRDKGRANAALAQLLSKALDLPVADIRIKSGPTSPVKLIEISGADERTVYERLGQPGPPA